MREELYTDVARPTPDGRPWVLSNMVATVDGAFTVSGRVGALSGPADNRLLKVLRSLCDVLLVGAATVRAERYGPVRLTDDLRAARAARGQTPVPPVAVVTASLSLDPASRFFTEAEARPILVVPRVAGDRARQTLGDVAEVIEAGDERVDLRRAVVALHERDAQLVLSEGGPTVLAELVAAGVLDEFCITVAPYLGGDTGNVVDRPLPTALVSLELAHAFDEEGDVFLRYLVRH